MIFDRIFQAERHENLNEKICESSQNTKDIEERDRADIKTHQPASARPGVSTV